MMMVEFLVYSAPIRTGKTTFLMKTFANRGDVSGFLTPDFNGIRMIYNLQSGQRIDFEVRDDKKMVDDQIIGKFRFCQKGFDCCASLMNDFIEQPNSIFIIDEVGKLEINDKGFEPKLTNWLRDVQKLSINCKIILIVRDSLMSEFEFKYHFLNFKMISQTELLCI
jgi:nucleoside-triphosphatase THEP1